MSEPAAVAAPATADVPDTEMSYGDALVFASQLHRGGQLDPAERLYRALLALNPNDPNPLHYLGVLLVQRGQSQEALGYIQRSIEADDQVAAWHNNLGNVLLDLGRRAEAVDAYQRCTELDPDNVEVLNNLGVMQRDAKRYDDAEATFRRAIAIKPDFADAHSNLAGVYYLQQRVKEGYVESAAALALQPAHSGARRMLGLVYARLGRLEEAAALYREWLEREPDNEQALHYLSACGGRAVPERAEDIYVERVFDAFASSFDAKLAMLDYKAPQLVAEALIRILGEPRANGLRVVDAGCGTGLCGVFLAPYASSLIGVDLSANMLARAAERGLYSELVKGELVAYLATLRHTEDVIVSADTLCYFGKLEQALAAARGAMKTGGTLAFTVESHDDGPGFRLNPHGRYSHRRDYVEQCLADAGFGQATLASVVLRRESGEDVGGWLVTAIGQGADT